MKSTTSAASYAPFARSATIYDELYRNRAPAYIRDVKRVFRIVKDYLPHSLDRKPGPLSVIDWGAGTGEHVRRLSQQGFKAIGFDSQVEMVKLAQAKGVDVRMGCMANMDPDCQLRADVQISLFASFSYAALDDQSLMGSLRNMASWGRPGSLVFIDVVNVTAAACHLRRNEELTGDGWSIRRVKHFDMEDSVVTIESRFEVDGQDEYTEVHRMRAFSPRELAGAMVRSRLDPLVMFNPEHPAPYGAPITPQDFYFAVVARIL